MRWSRESVTGAVVCEVKELGGLGWARVRSARDWRVSSGPKCGSARDWRVSAVSKCVSARDCSKCGGRRKKVWRSFFRVKKKCWNFRFLVWGLLDRNLDTTGIFISMMLMIFIFGFAKNIENEKC